MHEPSSEKQRVEPSVLIPKALLRVGGSGIKCLLRGLEFYSRAAHTQKREIGMMCKNTTVIPVPREQRHEGHGFKLSLGYLVSPRQA